MTSQDQKQIVAQIREHLLPHCFNAAVKAGAAIMKIYKNRDDYDITLKSDHTPILHHSTWKVHTFFTIDG